MRLWTRERADDAEMIARLAEVQNRDPDDYAELEGVNAARLRSAVAGR